MAKRERRGLSPDGRRAQRLLVGGLIGGHLGALASSLVFFVWRGPSSGLSCLVAAVITLAFYTIGQAVQVAMADAPPQRVLTASLISYGVRVSALAGLLAVATTVGERLAGMDPVAVVVGTLSVVGTWLGAEIWTFSRLRFPIYDAAAPDAPAADPAVRSGESSC